MHRKLILILAFLSLLFHQVQAAEWPEEFYIMTQKRALSLMPLSLKEVLEDHKKDIYSGMYHALQNREYRSVEDTCSHVSNKVRQATGMIEARRPFREVCYVMGELCGLLCEYNSPFYADPAKCGGPELRKRFFTFTRDKLHLFVPVFGNKEQGKLTIPTLESRIKDIIARSDNACARLAKGSVDQSHDWDVRSVQFGISSLACTHAILDVADVWLLLWSSAGGDMRDAPDWWKEEQAVEN